MLSSPRKEDKRLLLQWRRWSSIAQWCEAVEAQIKYFRKIIKKHSILNSSEVGNDVEKEKNKKQQNKKANQDISKKKTWQMDLVISACSWVQK